MEPAGEFISEEQVVSLKATSITSNSSLRHNYDFAKQSSSVASFNNSVAGSGIDNLESLGGKQLIQSSENEKNCSKREDIEQQHWLSNQVEMIVAEPRRETAAAKVEAAAARNNDNDHSFEGRESFSGDQTDRGGVGEERGEGDEDEDGAGCKITASEIAGTKQKEWNLMQIVESAESKLMRRKQARDEEARMSRSQQFRCDIHENQSKTQIQSQTKNENDNSLLVKSGDSFGLPNSSLRRVSRSGLMLKSPAFATITLEQEHFEDENNLNDNDNKNKRNEKEEREEMEKKPFVSSVVGGSDCNPAVAAATATREVVSDCGRKFGPTSCKVATTETAPNERHRSGGNVTAGNMTNRLESKPPTTCWSEEKLKYNSNVCENSAQVKSLFVPNTGTPTSYKAFLLQNSPSFGRDDDTKQQQQQSSTAETCSVAAKDQDCLRLCDNARRRVGEEDGKAKEEEEEEGREGPTPTNDLIRALIQRDKVALSAKWNQHELGQTKTLPSRSRAGDQRTIDSSPSWSASSPSPSNDKTGSPCPFSSTSSPSPTCSPSSSSSSSSPQFPHLTKQREQNQKPNQQQRQRNSIAIGHSQKQVDEMVAKPSRRKRKRAKQMRAVKEAKSKPTRRVLDLDLTKTSRQTTRKPVIRTETVEPNLTSSVDYYENNKQVGGQRAEKSRSRRSNSNISEQELSQIDTVTTAVTTSSAYSSPSATKTSGSNTYSNANADARYQQLANKMLDTPRDKRTNWDSFAASALELSAQLISKCHLVASGHSDGGELGGSVTNDRKPSDVSLKSEYIPQQTRRHSTYMLPMLLNKDPNDNTLSSSSSSSEQVSESNGTEFSDALADQELAELLNRDPHSNNLTNSELTSYLPGRQALIKNSTFLSKNAKLTTSASSPSALSTPTNDRGGCGGPCCRQPTETANSFGQPNQVGVSRGNLSERNTATVTNEQANVMKRIRKLSLFSGNHGFNAAESSSAKSSKVWNKNSELQGQQQQPRRRTGSNPLERLRLTTNNHLTSGEPLESGNNYPRERGNSIIKLSTRARIQSVGATNELTKFNSKSGKRHSIINLLAGNGANNNGNGSSNVTNNLLSSKAVNPRSMFPAMSSNRDGIKNQTDGSLESNMNKLTATATPNSSWIENHLSFTSNKLHSTEQQCQNHHRQQQQHDQQCEPLIPESGFKIVVMGTSGSGKTSIIQRFMYNSFNWRHLPTVEDTYFIEFPYKKNLINISISDTSGE